ncbi:hypothetical protein RGC42_03885 [Helicobacter pylori]|nr:hypothetical protein [Helicobacter pylori]MDU9767730.1 hypothetical protein [Helicobacter pylori]
MRHKNETAISFNKLKKITLAITPTQARSQAKAHQSTPKPKGTARAKKSALKPTKRAFSERQNTAFRDNSPASEEIQKGGGVNA